MSVACMTWVFTHSTSAGSDRLLLLAIADHAGDDGGNAWPSVPTLARKTGISERSVQRGIARLEQGGHLEVERGQGRGGTNRYRVVMPLVTGADVTPATARQSSTKPRQSVTGDRTAPVTELRHPRGDTQVSPERPERPSTPQPPEQAQGAKCTHGRSRNCRRCGTSPRGVERSERLAAAQAAAAEVARIEQERADLPWCRDIDCNPEDRWRSPEGGRVHRCPECNPDVVIGRPPPDLLELAALAHRPLAVVGAR